MTPALRREISADTALSTAPQVPVELRQLVRDVVLAALRFHDEALMVDYCLTARREDVEEMG